MSQGTALGVLKSFPTLTYPSDLSEEHFFPEAIRFGFHRRSGVDFDVVVGEAKTKYGEYMDTNSPVGKSATGEDIVRQVQLTLGPADKDSMQAALAAERKRQGVDNLDREESWVEEWKQKAGAMLAAAGGAGSSVQVQNSTLQPVGNIYLDMQKLAGAGVGAAVNVMAAAAGGIVGTILS